MEITFEDLRPGTDVINVITGMRGTIRSSHSNPNRCYQVGSDSVAVRTRIQDGKNKGKFAYRYWALANIDIVVESVSAF